MTLRFKWWQGLLIGVLIGISLWYAQAALDGWGKPSRADGVSLRTFISVARIGDAVPAGIRHLTNVRVHPPMDDHQLITATAVGGGRPATAVEVITPMPFTTPAPAFGLGTAKSYPSVREYLTEAAPKLSYRYAWWEEPRFIAAVWIGTPVVLLGVLLPLVMEILMRLGVIARPPPVIKPPKPAPAAAPEMKPEPHVDHAAIASQLQAATDDLEHRLATGTHDPEQPATAVATAATATLFRPGTPDEPLAPLPEQPATDFDGGEFYPVHRPKRGE